MVRLSARLEPRNAELSSSKAEKSTLTESLQRASDWLTLPNKNLDAAVAAAYGWPADA